MFNYLKNLFKKEDSWQEQNNKNLWDGITHQVFRIDKLEKELHGWQSAMYSLMNALNLDLVKDENGQVQVKNRHRSKKK